MKILSIMILLCSIQILYAGSTKPVFHAHDGRIHNHSLPIQGLAHRHGSGAPGVIARSTNRAGSITSTVTYSHTKPSIKPPKPYRPSGTNNKQISSHTRPRPNDRFLQNYTGRRQNGTKGDTRCLRGQLDCNVCAANVQQQFQKAAAKQISWRSQLWQFTWPKQYPPYNKRPLDIFDGTKVHALGIPDKHVQGFVRTNSTRFPYAGSHSHKKRGGIFVIKQEREGKKYLSSLHQTKGKHPSGVHVIGKYLVYGLGNRLIFKDLNSHQQKNDISLKIPKPVFGGGLGIIKLSRDKHLIVTSGPGGQDKRPRYNRFYHLNSINGRPSSIQFISESPSIKPATWPRGLTYSENLSLITECGTGDIYTVHTSGDEKGISAIRGNGYWRLSKLMDRQNKLSLKAISAFSTQQNMSSCNVRAAATVFVNPQHKLEFYCHGYAKDPKGSTFNVLGSSNPNNDKFRFKVGILR